MRSARFIGKILTLIGCAVLFLFSDLTVLALQADFTQAEPIRIGFLDSGVSVKHLAAAQVTSGENLVFPDSDTADRNGHGTETVGIVLGSSDGAVPGIFPQAIIVPLVCYDRYPSGVAERVTPEQAADAVYRAVDRYGCRVINISLGFSEDNDALRKAIEYAAEHDVLVVAAVGNDNESNPDKVYYPAAYDSVLGVGCAENGKVCSFSQRHGVNLVTDSRYATVSNKNSADLVLRVGTSYACAYISGLCAKLRARNANLTAEEIKAVLFAAAQDIEDTGFDSDSGYGYIPAVFPERYAAVQKNDSILTLSRPSTAAGLAVYARRVGRPRADFDDVPTAMALEAVKIPRLYDGIITALPVVR